MKHKPIAAYVSRLLIKFAAVLVLLTTGISAYAHDDESHKQALMIEGAWAPHTGKRTHSAAIYFKIINEGSEPDVLIAVDTPAANSATLHESKEVDGIMRMDHVPALTIPAGSSVSLQPGSYHIMLMMLAAPLKRGEIFPLTLSFEHAGNVTITVEITGIGGPE